MDCPFCKTFMSTGADTCTGCSAEIVHRNTPLQTVIALGSCFFVAISCGIYLEPNLMKPGWIDWIKLGAAFVVFGLLLFFLSNLPFFAMKAYWERGRRLRWDDNG